MTLFLWLLAVVLMGGAFLGLLVPNVPGPPILFAGILLAAWAEDFAHVGFRMLLVLGIMTVVALLADLLAGAWSARRFGGSRYAVGGAALGAIGGIFFGFVGVLIGPIVGAAAGEFLFNRNLKRAGSVGLGTSLGLIIGTVAKAAVMFAMLSLFLLVRLW